MSVSNVRDSAVIAVATTNTRSGFSCSSTKSERFLIAIVFYNTGSADITSVTYDGVALTLVHSRSVTDGYTEAIYYMPEVDLPVPGDYDLVATFGSSRSSVLYGLLAEADGEITVLDDNSNGTNSNVDTLDVVYDNTGKDLASTMVYDFAMINGNKTFAQDDGQTQVNSVRPADSEFDTVVSRKQVSSAGTFTQSHTTTVSGNWFIAGGVVLDEIAADIQKAFSDAGAEGTESFVKAITVQKALSDAGALGSESFAIIFGKSFSDAGAEGAESFAITKNKAITDAGAEGAETFSKMAFITPAYLQNKFEAIMVKIIE